MTEAFQATSRDDQSSLPLEAYDRDYFVAELSGLNLHARARVGPYRSGGLADLFAEMAAQWRGWEGSKSWSSLEGGLHLTAEADRTGHVTLTSRLSEGRASVWTVVLALVLEAGQLEAARS